MRAGLSARDIMPGSTPESLPDARTHEDRGMKAREVMPANLPDTSGREASAAGPSGKLAQHRKARETSEEKAGLAHEGKGR